MPPVTAATIRPARRIRGRFPVPSDKSISHRYAILGALADGTTTIARYSPGADCRSTLSCLSALGVEVLGSGPDRLTVGGRGLGGLRPPAAPLDAGNSGTTMRMLAGVLAGHPFTARLVGDASLSRRPMGRVMAPLALMGAGLEASDGHPPLTIRGRSPLAAITFAPPVPSAQVKSAVLLAGLHAAGTTTVVEPAATRDHTERALEAFGVPIVRDGLAVSVEGGRRLHSCELSVPGDFSSAAFWLAAAAALPGSRVEIVDVGLNPTRTGLLDVLRRFGARVTVDAGGPHAGEPSGTVIVEGNETRAIDISPAEVPGLIDELPAIGAMASLGGAVTVRGATELRVKESDRIATLVAGFRALGVDAVELADGFAIRGGPTPSGPPAGGRADACGDHRMAMAFAVAALGAAGPSVIEGADSVDISYPGFFETLDRLIA
jgi:3-phosphoshikimate 1-carboxyvinyltransferase